MAAELDGTGVTVNLLLPGGATATGMVPSDAPAEFTGRLLEPTVMAAPIVWLASSAAVGVHGQRIVANEFDDWLTRHTAGPASTPAP
jgi:NAD(P)-dependent dehydrogenase (short-subunit alcohol dehydrogenase family)